MTARPHARWDPRSAPVDASVAQTWAEVERLGGRTGWHVPDVLWRTRGLFDRAIGGPGHPRRRDPGPLTPGMRVDSWRVERVRRTPQRAAVEFVTTMKLPGTAALIILVEQGADPQRSIVHYTVRFAPASRWGLAYWYLSYPAHAAVFAAMQAGLVRAAER